MRHELTTTTPQNHVEAVLKIIDAAATTATADILPAAPRPVSIVRDSEPDKFARMLDTILAEITAAHETILRPDFGPNGCRSYAGVKLTNAAKLAALARSVHLERQRATASEYRVGVMHEALVEAEAALGTERQNNQLVGGTAPADQGRVSQRS